MKVLLILGLSVLALASHKEVLDEIIVENESELPFDKVLTNSIIDVTHWQGTEMDFAAAAFFGLQAVVARATHGSDYADPNFTYYREQAQNAGLHFGASHLPDGTDPIKQAENFLSTIGNPNGQLLVLSFENNPDRSNMLLPQAVQFVQYIKQQTGLTPVIYGGDHLREEIREGNTILNSLPLWVYTYRTEPMLPGGWDDWSFWQYTDGVAGPSPRSTPGLGTMTSKSVFNGTRGGLDNFWLKQSQPY